jgi:hypothetical protein
MSAKPIIAAMDGAALTRLCIDCVLVDRVTATRWDLDRQPANLLAIAKAYGIALDDAGDTDGAPAA